MWDDDGGNDNDKSGDIDIDFVNIHRTQGITNFMRMEMKMTSC